MYVGEERIKGRERLQWHLIHKKSEVSHRQRLRFNSKHMKIRLEASMLFLQKNTGCEYNFRHGNQIVYILYDVNYYLHDLYVS